MLLWQQKCVWYQNFHGCERIAKLIRVILEVFVLVVGIVSSYSTLSSKMESKRIWIFVAVIAVFAASQGFYFPYSSQCLKITIKSLILQLCERSEPRLSLIFRAKNLHPQVHFLAPTPHITHPPVLRTSHPT